MDSKEIDATTARHWLDSGEAILIDVREPAEHATIKIIGAHSHPLHSLNQSSIPETHKKIIIHCQKGKRGEKACQKMISTGTNCDLYNLTGGIEAWQQAGLPVEKGPKNTLPINNQTQITIGLSVILFGLLGYFINQNFIWGAVFFGLGLVNAGLTGWCGLAKVVAKMPWNQSR